MWKDINAIENAFVPYRDETIKKWCDKIQTASATSVGAHKKFKTINQGTLDQIKTLMNDKERLVKKTRLKRGSYKILGEVKEKGGYGSLGEEGSVCNVSPFNNLRRHVGVF